MPRVEFQNLRKPVVYEVAMSCCKTPIAGIFHVSVFNSVLGKKLMKGPRSLIKPQLVLIPAIEIYLQFVKATTRITGKQSPCVMVKHPFIPYFRARIDGSGGIEW